MLKDIKFCSCGIFNDEGTEENQCMFFSFTDRALKMLNEQILKQISDTGENGNQSIGFFAGIDKNGEEKYVTIQKIEDNYWRIPTIYVDPLIRFLFKYLPAYYISPEEKEKTKCKR